VSEETGSDGGQTEKGAVRRTLDTCVLTPVGMAVTAVEDLPGLVAKGRRHVELQLANARVVGHFVVSKSQRRVSDRLGGFLRNEGAPPDPVPTPAAPAPPVATRPPPVPDEAAGAVVEGALADYDTLSASQVVRRLESLGPDQLRAVQRYESSTRNRRTILNRAGQLLDEHPASPPVP
jgi:hypothetical protein